MRGGWRKLEMQNRLRVAGDGNLLLRLGKTRGSDRERVFAKGHGRKAEGTVGLAEGRQLKVALAGMKCNAGMSDGAVLRIMHNTARGSKDGGKGMGGQQQKGRHE